MHWLLENWQTAAALAIVAVTALVFALRLARPKKAGSCGGGCDCKMKAGPGRDVRNEPRPAEGRKRPVGSDSATR